MDRQKTIAIFDIGKTNKKFYIFSKKLQIEYQQEIRIESLYDQEGNEYEDVDSITDWIYASINSVIKENKYDLHGINFTTYGATLVFLDQNGEKIIPVNSYLREIPVSIQDKLFLKYGGETEFSRCTASPVLGQMLNSGLQILWLKNYIPDKYNKIRYILHLPQYLSYLFTGQFVSEFTSIGCHTFLWDFDRSCYHQWLKDEGIHLPGPSDNSVVFTVKLGIKKIQVGIGIHDSSSSIVPYLAGSSEKFILVSTGTWCINMNPFNHTSLTEEQLKHDCLNYLSIHKLSVKSSRLFLGRIHDEYVNRLSTWFGMEPETIFNAETNDELMKGFMSAGQNVFFVNGIHDRTVDEKVDLSQFKDFSSAYHRLVFELARMNANAMHLILDDQDINTIYVSGGFARNEIFVRSLATLFYDKEVYTSQIENSSALGAALAIWNVMDKRKKPKVDLNLKKWNSF